MMRSMFTGVAGLRTHQTKMDVIGNNISNVNTVGYKSSSVTFKEIFSQTMQGASSANPETGRGGTNPLQVGLGVGVASIDNLMAQGAAQTTDNPLDLMINGGSFFIVGDSSGQYFTRAGSFRLDAQGNLVNPQGFSVYGWNAVEDPNNPGSMKVEKGKVQPLSVKSPKNMQIKATPTSSIAFEGNLNMLDGQTDGIVKAIDFYDTLGNHYKVDINFWYVPDDGTNTGYWRFEPSDTATRNNTSTIAFSWSHSGCILEFDSNGNLIASDDNYDGDGLIKFNVLSPLGMDAETLEMTLDFKGLTQYVDKTTVKGASLDGCPPGDLIGFSIGPDGIITGSYSNGRSKTLGQVAVASFKNPAGLEKVGDNLFVTTANSGGFDGIGEDPTSGGGSIGGGRLEMSNVDLAREFTEMITTQRGFQANSRVITTSDEILQELVRLK